MRDAGQRREPLHRARIEVRRLAETEPAMREALHQLGRRPQIDNTKAKTLLGWSPRPVEDTILDTAHSLLRAETDVSP